MKNIDEIFDAMHDIGCKSIKDAPMKDYTSFKIGGAADLLLLPDNISTLQKVVEYCTSEKYQPFILGNGSNLLVSDSGIRGVVIFTGNLSECELIDECTIRCETGLNLASLCNFALENSLTGLEFAFGIPGSAGGAAYMNAGAYGGEMKDVLAGCTHITPKGEIEYIKSEDLGLGYRKSIYSYNRCIITSVDVSLTKGNREKIKAVMTETIEKRKSKQPLEYPSAGSVFKRPEGYFAGALIEQCGFKGKRVGGAQLSEKHAGFIVNTGSATAKDVKDLIKVIQDEVFDKFGVRLETEIKMV